MDTPLGSCVSRFSKVVWRISTNGRQHTEANRKKVQNKPNLSNPVSRLKRDVRMRKAAIAIQLMPSITRSRMLIAGYFGFERKRQSRNPLPTSKGGSISKLKAGGKLNSAPIAI